MIRCGHADAADIPALKRLWRLSFDDTDRAIDNFFSRFFSEEHCVAAYRENRLAAALYMLPAGISGENTVLPAHYIYAAATMPEHRGQGMMAELLNYAAQQGTARGDCFSVLVPANEGLFAYYEKQGYREHSAMRKVIRTREACIRWLENRSGKNFSAPETDPTPEVCRIVRIRNDYIKSRAGSLLWDEQAVARALSMAGVYGGRILCPDDGGYALIRSLSRDHLDVQECIASDKAFDKIMVQMVNLGFKTYSFRLPNDCCVFGTEGTTVHFSMIKPLGDVSVPHSLHPYVGLPLD